MIIFYTTFNISDEAYNKGLDFLRNKYIPAATRSGLLHSPRMQRVINEVEDATGTSVSVQFSVDDMDTLQKWIQRESEALHQEINKTFGDNMLGFSTLLEELDV